MTPSEAIAAFDAELAKHRKLTDMLNASIDWKHKHWSEVSGMVSDLRPILETHVERLRKQERKMTHAVL